MPECRKHIFTLGHSNLDPEEFLAMLSPPHVEIVADVRSRPQSGRFPQFSQMVLEKMLQARGIKYAYFGEELGGRPDDIKVYLDDGRVDYRARRSSYAFRAGLDRLLNLSEKRIVALLCAEEDPLECHRFLMVCPELVSEGVSPLHIRRGAGIETQEAAENRLLEAHDYTAVAVNTLFPQARMEALEKAYDLQAEKVAFRVDPTLLHRW